MTEDPQRRRQYRYRATLKLSFKYAGRRNTAITTELSPRGASLVAAVRLPVGAILIFDVDEAADLSSEGKPVRLIAQVNWAGPAPFGGSEAFAAGVEILRATGGSWTDLLASLRERLRAEGRFEEIPTETARPATPVSRTSGFEALFNHEGVWFRGEIVTANMSTVWVRTARMAPPLGAPVRVRIAVRDSGKLVAVDVSGRVPGSPLPDQDTSGWVFELEVEKINHTELYNRLLERIHAQSLS
ncbi:MAG: hypothetical protein ACI9WU_004681 [Myxococcota bacterium]|jgi:hypothetical protein